MSAQTSNHYSRSAVVLMTLDVKSVFKLLRWTDVLNTLEHRFYVFEPLLRMIQDYLSEQVLIYDITESTIKKNCVCWRGTEFEFGTWNVMYIMHSRAGDFSRRNLFCISCRICNMMLSSDHHIWDTLICTINCLE